jgi:hypothetical protein
VPLAGLTDNQLPPDPAVVNAMGPLVVDKNMIWDGGGLPGLWQLNTKNIGETDMLPEAEADPTVN